MTNYDTDRFYWLRKENRKLYKDLSFCTSIRFTWGRNWRGLCEWFWYKLNRCPVCKKKIFWEYDSESIDGHIMWEGDIPYHVDDEWNDKCEGVC